MIELGKTNRLSKAKKFSFRWLSLGLAALLLGFPFQGTSAVKFEMVTASAQHIERAPDKKNTRELASQELERESSCLSDFRKSDEVEAKFYQAKIGECNRASTLDGVADCAGVALAEYMVGHKTLVNIMMKCKMGGQ